MGSFWIYLRFWVASFEAGARKSLKSTSPVSVRLSSSSDATLPKAFPEKKQESGSFGKETKHRVPFFHSSFFLKS